MALRCLEPPEYQQSHHPTDPDSHGRDMQSSHEQGQTDDWGGKRVAGQTIDQSQHTTQDERGSDCFLIVLPGNSYEYPEPRAAPRRSARTRPKLEPSTVLRKVRSKKVCVPRLAD